MQNLKFPEDKIYMAEAWQKWGGGFVQRLGSALAYADQQNTMIILRAFDHYVMDYFERALEIKTKRLKNY